MITKIGVQGFKALQDVELELGAVNVVIGANGVGKSSLLEAIGVLGAAVGGRVDAESLHRRGVRLGQPAIYKTSLAEQDYRRSISLSAYGEPEVGYHVSLSNPVKRPEPVWKYDTESLEVEGKRVAGRSPRGSRAPEVGTLKEPLSREAGLITALMAHFRPSVRSFLQVLGDYRIFAPTTPVLRGVAQDSAPVPPLGLSGGDLAERVGELLEDEAKGERLLDLIHRLIPWVEEVRVVAPSKALIPPALPMPRRILAFTDRRMRKGRNQISAYDASEGLLYALFLFTLALHPQMPSFFAVDNVGFALHPRLRQALIGRFCDLLLETTGEAERQVILTTHDPLILDGLPLWDDRVRLFAMDRDGRGRAVIRRVTVDEEFQKLKEEKGLVLSDLWIEGWLGGVPGIWE